MFLLEKDTIKCFDTGEKMKKSREINPEVFG